MIPMLREVRELAALHATEWPARLAAIRGPVCAEIFPNDGLRFLHDWFPRQSAAPATLYVGMFTNFTASTVGDITTTIGSMVEPTGGSYGRQPLPAASWAAAASTASGVVSTAAQVSFLETQSAYGPTHAVNGYFLTDKATGSGAMLAMSNFTDAAGVERPAVIVNGAGIVVRVTPAWKRTN